MRMHPITRAFAIGLACFASYMAIGYGLAFAGVICCDVFDAFLDLLIFGGLFMCLALLAVCIELCCE